MCVCVYRYVVISKSTKRGPKRTAFLDFKCSYSTLLLLWIFISKCFINNIVVKVAKQ